MNNYDLILSAAQKNQPDRIRQLVEQQRVPVDHTNGVGQSALHVACLWGHVEAITTLLELGAPVNAVNQLGQSTPMHMAVAGRKPEAIATVVDLLLQYGADVNIADVQRQLPFDLCPQDAPWKDKVAPAPPLWYTALQQVDLTAFQTACTDSSKTNPVDKWSFRGQLVIECMFQNFVEKKYDEASIVWPFLKFWFSLRHGDPIPNKDEDSFFAQYIQQRRPQHSDLVKLILPHLPADVWQWLQRSARRNDLAAVEYCVQILHVDPNLRGRQGMTALQHAARSGQMKVVQYLLERPDIDVHIADDRGQTPLDAARSNQQHEIIAGIEQKLGNSSNGIVEE